MGEDRGEAKLPELLPLLLREASASRGRRLRFRAQHLAREVERERGLQLEPVLRGEPRHAVAGKPRVREGERDVVKEIERAPVAAPRHLPRVEDAERLDGRTAEPR